MNFKLIALASTLLASAIVPSAAEAQGGVRLGFGGPLGTFVATPSNGGAAAGQHARKEPAQAAAKRKAAPKHLAAHAKPSKPKPAPRVAKADAPKVDVAKSETTEERLTGSSALIQSSIPAHADDETEGSPGADVEAKASATADTTVTAEAVSAKEGTCKKFIPAVSMTVSVGCED